MSTLFQSGTLGGLTDRQLLDRFVQRRDDMAFAALVGRHGPLVWHVCRNRLRNVHDAEDAFQAAFLVLACKAESIRNSNALASWLIGVASHVCTKARAAAERRRRAERQAEPRPSAVPAPAPPDEWTELYEELDRMPERYRTALVLCHLEGLTYEQAALRLQCAERTVQTRLIRGRERLQRQLRRRGIAPSMLLAADSARRVARTNVPAQLEASTVHVALGFDLSLAQDAALSSLTATLANEVLQAMKRSRFSLIAKPLIVAALLGAGGWYAWATSRSDIAFAPAPSAARSADVPVPPKAPAHDAKLDERFHVSGSVRLEGTGEPIAGARVQAVLGWSPTETDRQATTDARGEYRARLPEGNARAELLLPPGYWLPDRGSWNNFAVTPEQPDYRKDFVVRRGNVWTFRFAQRSDLDPVRRGHIWSMYVPYLQADTDAKGIVPATLPREGGSTITRLSANGVFLMVGLRWDQEFDSSAVKEIKRFDEPTQPARFALKDDAGRTAAISGAVEASITDGRIVISAYFPQPQSQSTGTLTGEVVDESGRPVAEANVSVWFVFRQGSAVADQYEHRVQTDGRGRYVLRSVPLRSHEGDPTKLQVVVRKDGYRGTDGPELVFQPRAGGVQTAARIRLQRGVSFHGRVVDPDGHPLVGAMVQPFGELATMDQSYRSGADGRFTIPNVERGVIPLRLAFGPLSAGGKYVADGRDDVVEIRLQRTVAPPLKEPANLPKPVVPLAVGQIAPELKVNGWSDGTSHSLSELRGKVVFLGFWGIWCGGCVQALPDVEKLRARFQPDVVFLAVHTPGESLENIRRLFKLKDVSLISAVDDGPEDDRGAGTTAQLYGVRGYPMAVLIDRAGKIAYRSDQPSQPTTGEAVARRLGIDLNAPMSDEQSSQLRSAVLTDAIEAVIRSR
jgi:RNA polymerase sigma factor (sigma-70 family)